MNIAELYNKGIVLAKCDNCGYRGNKGNWIGTKEINGEVTPLEGIVTLLRDFTWNLDDIISDGEYVGEVTGQCFCPICGSYDFD